jgi:Domain of unknown function (DUF4260)
MTTIERTMDPAATPTVTVRGWLRLEGAAVFLAGLVLYAQLGAPWWLAVPLLLLPDVSAAGYLAGPRIGALAYNVVHNWAFGLALLGVGLAASVAPIAVLGAAAIAHVGMDRAVGYGLKLPTSFQDTHLGRIGRDRGARQS